MHNKSKQDGCLKLIYKKTKYIVSQGGTANYQPVTLMS